MLLHPLLLGNHERFLHSDARAIIVGGYKRPGKSGIFACNIISPVACTAITRIMVNEVFYPSFVVVNINSRLAVLIILKFVAESPADVVKIFVIGANLHSVIHT